MAKFKHYIVPASAMHVAHRLTQKMGWPDHIHQGTAYVYAESKPKAAELMRVFLGSTPRPREIQVYDMGAFAEMLLPYVRSNAILIMLGTRRDAKVFRADADGLVHVATWRYDEQARPADRFTLEPVEGFDAPS